MGPERNPSENQDESLQSNCNSNTSVQLRNLDSLQTPEIRLDMVQQRHLRQLMDISWKVHVSNFQVLERAGMPSVEEMIITCQLRWTGHVTRMENSRLPKAVFYGELKEGSRKVGAPRLRYKDAFKGHLKNMNELENWREKAEDRVTWRKVVAGAADAIRRRNVQLWAGKRMRRLEKTPTHAEAAYTCDICGRTFEAAIGLTSHLRHRH